MTPIKLSSRVKPEVVLRSSAATYQLAVTTPPTTSAKVKSVITVDLDAFTQGDKLQLAAELINNVLLET